MTDVMALAKKLCRRINQQNVPVTVGRVDLVHFLQDAIEDLYVLSGRYALYSEDMFEFDESENECTFADDLPLDERKWVLKKAEIEFYKWVQTDVDTDTSYTTDAMSVTHGDAPWKNLDSMINKRTHELNRIWYSMTRYNTVGVAE